MRVTIEGTTTPSTFLGTGQRTTVEYTDFVRKIERRGYVRVIEKHDETVSKNSIKVKHQVEGENIEESDEKISDNEIHIPAPDDTKDVWLAFLKDQGISVTARTTKAAMIEAWEESRHG